MSSLVDKDQLLLPTDVLWNLTRLSRFSLQAFDITEDSELATISLTFDKTSLEKNYINVLQEKFKSSTLSDLTHSLLNFDPDSPLKPPNNKAEIIRSSTSESSLQEKEDESSNEGDFTTDKVVCSLEKVKIKQEPVSPTKSLRGSDTSHESDSEEMDKMAEAPNLDALKVEVKSENEDSLNSTQWENIQRERVSFQLRNPNIVTTNVLRKPQKKQTISATNIKPSAETKTVPKHSNKEEERSTATNLPVTNKSECDNIIDKLTKMSVKEKEPNTTSQDDEKQTSKIEKNGEKQMSKIEKDDKGKDKSTRKKKDKKIRYHETVGYYLDEIYHNIDWNPKKQSKYDYTYAIRDSEDSYSFAIEWTDDIVRHASVTKIKPVTLTWLQRNSKTIPSYIRRQATYRILKLEFKHQEDSHVLQREKRKLIDELID